MRTETASDIADGLLAQVFQIGGQEAVRITIASLMARGVDRRTCDRACEIVAQRFQQGARQT